MNDKFRADTVRPGETVVARAVFYPAIKGIVSWRWDFGDNATDTGLVTSHAYARGGRYWIHFYYRDEAGYEGEGQDPFVVDVNTAPGPVQLLSPAIRANNIPSGYVTFNWSCHDAEQQMLRYFIYYGTDRPDPANPVSRNDTFCTQSLEPGTIYFWCVTAQDNIGETSKSDTFYFATDGISGTTSKVMGYARRNGTVVQNGITVAMVPLAGTTLQTVTDSSGRYDFTMVLPGPYVITASDSGFVPDSVNDTVFTNRLELPRPLLLEPQ